VYVVVKTVAMAMHLRNFGPYGIMYMNVYVVVKTVAMAMHLRNFEPYGIMYMNVYVVVKMLLRDSEPYA
jgi:hypothetical protein